VLDIPDARSSHQHPTPRGGGLSVVLVCGAAWALLALSGVLDWREAAALLIGGGLVAAVGYYDDLRGASARQRLAVHVSVSAAVVLTVGPARVSGWLPIDALLTLLGLAWLVNLYNFMDGIDGLAASESVFVGLVGGVLLWITGVPGLAVAAWCVAAACGGFLVWNWAPAKIFMGDVCSGFLGLTWGVFAVMSARARAVPYWAWLALLGVFVVDTTITLIRRILHGERFWQPHRTHAYQHAVDHMDGRHSPVTLAIQAINLLWLAPAAVLVTFSASDEPVIALATLVPLVVLALAMRAGRP
jgi:Fuc2NAc and GlcNAc transferase